MQAGHEAFLHLSDNQSAPEFIIMKRIIEIRAAEGGADARLFTAELCQAFEALCLRRN